MGSPYFGRYLISIRVAVCWHGPQLRKSLPRDIMMPVPQAELVFKNCLFLQGGKQQEALKAGGKEWLQAGELAEENKIIRKHGLQSIHLASTGWKGMCCFSLLGESKQDAFSPAVFPFSSETSLSARIWKGWHLGRTDKHFSFWCLRAPGFSGTTRHWLASFSPKHFQLMGSESLQGKKVGAAVGCFLLPSHLRPGFPFTAFSYLLSHSTFGSQFFRLRERQRCLCGNVWFLLQFIWFIGLSGEHIQSDVNNGTPNSKTPSVNTVMSL